MAHWRIDFDHVLAAFAADDGPAAQIEIGASEERPQLLDRLSSDYNAVHVIIGHCTPLDAHKLSAKSVHPPLQTVNEILRIARKVLLPRCAAGALLRTRGLSSDDPPDIALECAAGVT
jgi:hypothetical protein